MSLEYFNLWLCQNRYKGTVKSILYYQRRLLSVELGLLRTRMTQIHSNTAFPYIYKHREPFYTLSKSVKNPFLQS